MLVFAGSGAACSGEAFRLAEIDTSADASHGSQFTGSIPRDDLGDAQLAPEDEASSSVTDAGPDVAPGPEPMPQPEPPGACGTLRANDPARADGEACLEPGTFTMGSAAGSLGAGYVSHGPAHTVGLSAFAIDVHEVSVARYRACVDASACVAPSTTLAQGCTFTSTDLGQELYPVTCVSWQEAQVFCAWDGGRRLPTEAEWERAARGSSSTTYPWGEVFDCTRAVLAGPTQCSMHAGVSPRAVGSTPSGASPDGVFDLIGNASEWVMDWFGAYSSGSVSDPSGPATGSTRIQRGGNWQTRAIDAVGYGRRAEAPAAVGSFSFRCARSAPP